MNVFSVRENDDIKTILSKNIYNSKYIKIATGYFSYRIFEMFKEEFQNLIDNNGEFKLVIGSDSSVKSLEFLKEVKNLTKQEVLESISTLYFDDFDDLSDEALLIVYNMFYLNILEVKVGVLDDGGLFHVKEYLFKTEDNNTYISGSLNFTQSALLQNHESVNCFINHKIYEDTEVYFDKMWNNLINAVSTVEINDYLISKCSSELERRGIKHQHKNQVKLRDYQIEAIDSLLENNFNGFLEMATGTGKTFTTIFGLKKHLEKSDVTHCNLIVVPLKHLAEQWKKQIESVFGKDVKIIECYSGHNWYGEFSRSVDRSDNENVFCIMVKHSFIQNLREIMETTKYSNNVLVVDEAHNMTKDNLEMLVEYKHLFKSKVGLSATPENYLDEERTELLFNYFEGTHYIFELKRAIDEGYLTKYTYNPTIVELDLEEEKKYRELSLRIQQEKDQFKMQKLLDDRSMVLSKAKNKINELVRIINEVGELEYSLVYCNPGTFILGENETRAYIDQISIEIEERTNIKPKKRKITYSEPVSERNKIVNDFENKIIDMILAIKCLDEGYDIPAVQNAFILHSTRNPSEFVQRRGRVLRKFEGKEVANIFDFIVMVNGIVPDDEKRRFDEYHSLSANANKLEAFRDKYIGEYEYE